MGQTRKMWLIRKFDLRVFRPLEEAKLIQMIEAGELKPNDEICRANGYWFPLQDTEEVRRHLGDVKLNSLASKGAEKTSSTDTDPLPKTKTQILQPNPKIGSSQSTMANFRASMEPRAVEEKDEPHDRRRALIFVIAAFCVFLFLLVSIWSGTH
jgi:hypothetical protein